MFTFGHWPNHLNPQFGRQTRRFACTKEKNSDDDNDGCNDNYDDYDNGDKKY